MQRTLARRPAFGVGRLVAGSLLGATVAFVVFDIVVWSGQRFLAPPVSFIQGQGAYIAEMVYAMAYATMGHILATRLPRNPLGWIFLLMGTSMAGQMLITFLVQEGHQAFRPMHPLLVLAAWGASSMHLPLLVVGYVWIFLLFPDGVALTKRWALAGWAAGAGAVAIVAGVGGARAGILWYPSLPNPFAAPVMAEPVLTALTAAGLLLVVAAVLASTASLAVRYHRAGQVQRAQLRWVAAAVMLLAACGLPFVIARYALQLDYASGEILLIIALLAGGFLPIAAAVAITRHRLYDIDILINRALVYIPLTGILGGLYAAGVATFQRVFVTLTGDRSDAAIIITTLVMASLFTPIRNTLQGFVDRRFKPAGSAPAQAAPSTQAPMELLNERVAALEEQVARLRTE